MAWTSHQRTTRPWLRSPATWKRRDLDDLASAVNLAIDFLDAGGLSEEDVREETRRVVMEVVQEGDLGDGGTVTRCGNGFLRVS